ncbi:IS66-like element accessory protein TnpA, partial [Maritalea sp.]|uniref:IS66-like element accessory protein TnpA n=1 Tax=Maritalea sp. TaxID=2003361 RepID=UPI003EF1C5F2
MSTIGSGHLEGKKGQKKRFWSDEEKVSICAQTCAPGVSVAQVARRYAMNTNLIHKWLRDPQFAPDREIVEDEVAETPYFLPVEIVDRPQTKGTVPTADDKPAHSGIEIDIAGGHQLRIVGSYDREVRRNGGSAQYRAIQSEAAAWERT